MKSIIVVTVIYGLLVLAFFGGLIWVAAHFIAKFW